MHCTQFYNAIHNKLVHNRPIVSLVSQTKQNKINKTTYIRNKCNPCQKLAILSPPWIMKHTVQFFLFIALPRQLTLSHTHCLSFSLVHFVSLHMNLNVMSYGMCFGMVWFKIHHTILWNVVSCSVCMNSMWSLRAMLCTLYTHGYLQ